MHQECRERFPCHRLQRKLLISDPGMHHGTCIMHVLWCMSGLLTHGGGENVPGIPGACAICNFTYLARGLWLINRNMPVSIITCCQYSTIDSWYILVDDSTVLNTIPLGESLNFIEIMISQKTPHTSPLLVSYGACFVSYLEKSYREISKMHCIWWDGISAMIDLQIC